MGTCNHADWAEGLKCKAHLGTPKVTQLELMRFSVDQQILRFDVTMTDA